MSPQDKCHRAYERAILSPLIRRDLDATGRAIYMADDDLLETLWPIHRRYTLSRIELKTGAGSYRVIVYCNGVEVDGYVAGDWAVLV